MTALWGCLARTHSHYLKIIAVSHQQLDVVSDQSGADSHLNHDEAVARAAVRSTSGVKVRRAADEDTRLLQ